MVLYKQQTFFIFDKYFPNSTTTFTRIQRAGSSRVYNITPEMQAPAKNVILTNSKNKIQLNSMLSEGLLDPAFYTFATQTHTLTLAGVGDVPFEISGGVKIDRHDLRSKHEEADFLITQHAISSSLLGKSVGIVCDDTDVFALLVHFYNKECKTRNAAPMIISSLAKERAVVDIRATAEAHSDIAYAGNTWTIWG